MSQQGNVFKQRYYRNCNNLRLCRPVLLSGIHESEHVAAGLNVQIRYYRNLNILSFCRQVLLSIYAQSEHVVAGESIQTTILSEP